MPVMMKDTLLKSQLELAFFLSKKDFLSVVVMESLAIFSIIAGYTLRFRIIH